MEENQINASPGSPGGHSGGRRAMRTGGVVALCACALAMGLLIWAKLRLVTGVPRTAVADPPAQLHASPRAEATSPGTAMEPGAEHAAASH